MMPKVTIIMPVYNAEKFLEEALISIQKQIFTEYELICVDDASTDRTLDILRKFQQSDERIKILINEERLGAAMSRNKALDVAKGEYVSFLDGDDIFDEEMLQLAVNTIEKHFADIVMFDYKFVLTENIYEKRSCTHHRSYYERYCKASFSITEKDPRDYIRWNTGPCNKLFKRSHIECNSLRFQTLSCCNDVYFVEMALLLAKRIIVVNDNRVMLYIRNHFTPSRISYNRDPMCIYYAMMRIGEELVRRNLFHKYYRYFYLKTFHQLYTTWKYVQDDKVADKFRFFLKTEGVNNLQMLNKNGESINDFEYTVLDLFKQDIWDKKAFEKIVGFQYYLDLHKERLLTFFQKKVKESKKILIWGSGRNGEAFLDFCIENHLKIHSVVDCSPEKQGQVLYGYEIKKPEEVISDVDTIIVTPYGAFEDVRKQINDDSKDVISLEDFLDIVR